MIGFVASIPLGPIGVLCIQRTLSKGRMSGFVSGAGAATSDFLYAVVAAFSVSIVTDFINEHQRLLEIVGAVVLICLGVNMLMAKPAKFRRRNNRTNINLWQDYVSTLFLTLSNPMALIVFLAAFSLIGASGSRAQQAMMVCGVLMGALCWWLCLTLMVGLFRHKLTIRRLLYINRIAGAVIIVLVLSTVIIEFARIVAA